MYNDLGKEHCRREDLERQFKAYDISMTKQFFDHIVLDLFNISHNIVELPFQEIENLYLDYDMHEEEST